MCESIANHHIVQFSVVCVYHIVQFSVLVYSVELNKVFFVLCVYHIVQFSMRMTMRPVALSIVLMVSLSFVIAYWIMPINMTTVNRQDSVLKLYRALFMSFLMLFVAGFVRAVVSWRVLTRRARNFVIWSIVLGVAGFVLVRQALIVTQAGLNTPQFARAMIEHHQNAIYMADVLLRRNDVPPDMQALAVNISRTQADEIAFMLTFI